MNGTRRGALGFKIETLNKVNFLGMFCISYRFAACRHEKRRQCEYFASLFGAIDRRSISFGVQCTARDGNSRRSFEDIIFNDRHRFE